ncbi:Hypothetical predicted protein [Pelobates cultripes]|uniref:Uncharacterized protein n=1 Tax=Pelobates cultripes TaxID=61616 RepID=A0AAD1SH12_PELCU|nr:Hypothetical predicted protein [Pelobates cultripes]
MYVVGLSRGLRRPPAPSSPRQRPPIVAHGSTPDRIKEWLLATGDEFVNLDGSIQLIMEKQKSEIFKICSDHFTSDMIVKSERRTRLVLMAKPTIFVKAKVLQTLHDMTLRRAENSSDIEMLDLSAPSADRSASTEGHSAPSEDLGAPSEDLGAPSEDLGAPSEDLGAPSEDLGAPSEDLGAPSEDLGAPSEDLGAQSETSIYDHEYIAGFHYKLAFDKSFMNIATNTTNLTMIAKGVSTSKYYGRRSRSTQTHSVIQTSDVSTNIIGLNPTKDVWTWTGPTEEFAGSIDNSPNAAIVQQTDTIKKVCTMPGAMPMETELLLSPNSQQSVPVENIDTPFSNISSITRVSEMDATLNVSEFNDPIYSPEEETTDIGDLTFLTEPSPEDYVSEKKFIVFETSLDLLIKKVQTCTFHEPCNAPITNTEKIISGTLLKVYTKSWLKKNGVAYSKLRSFVTDSKLEKDFPHLVHFCHTGSLEVFHSLVLKYRPKRVHFTMDGMVARTQLAVLAHNANVGREQATIQKEQAGTGHIGDLRFKPFFSKRSKNWKIKKIYEKTTIAHIYPMMADVLRIASGDLQVNWQSQTGQLPINIASTPRPPKEVMVDRHFSRLRPRRL